MPAPSPCPIRVLMIDQSAIFAQLFGRELGRQFDLELIGTSRELTDAAEKVENLKPDVIALDIEMPRLDGIAFIANLMQHSRPPIVILASPTDQGAALAMEALAAGAVDVLFKPDRENSIDRVIANLLEKIRAARNAKVIPLAQRPAKPRTNPLSPQPSSETILAIGASHGGIGALDEVLAKLPANSPGALIVSHWPQRVTSLLAHRLNQICDIEIKEATTGDRVVPGQALIAPGGRHMLLRRSGSDYFVHIKDGPEVFHQKPSVDVLFNSLAKAAGRNAIAALLSASGTDGMQGLLNVRKAGGKTIAADDGIARPAAERVVPLPQIAAAIIEMALQPSAYRTAQ